MFANIEDWKTDAEAEKKGVPLDLGEGRIIYVRRAGGANRRWTYAVATLAAEMREKLGRDELTSEERDEAALRATASELIASWEGLVDGNDIPIEYSPTAAEELFSVAPDIYERVTDLAMDREAYRLAGDRKSD